MLEETETAIPIISRAEEQPNVARIVGGRTRVLVRSEQVKGAYAVLDQEIPPGKGPPFQSTGTKRRSSMSSAVSSSSG